ncbi:MAG: tRNA lysidine(34) synthetase TilS [Ignavibacteria bacterium]|nr:MAG: tRNA lysidine(34) synthetase TilS [Ignavibacteria bacterium]
MTATEPFLGNMRRFIRDFRLIDRGEKIILAVSGGLDSMVLLDALDDLKRDSQLTLSVAHFNHQLRGIESDRDEALLRSVALARGLECYVERANTRAAAEAQKLSVEECARNLRYAFFEKLRSSLGYQKIATAHHADDNAETILFNLFRGAGVHGLSGIPVRRNDQSIIRPLLFATRKQIEGYAAERKVSYREDASNAEREYTRNFLRHDVIPLIRENINPNLIGTLSRTAELFDQLEEYLNEQARNIMPGLLVRGSEGSIILDLTAFRAQPVFLREHVLLHTAREFTAKEIDFATVKSMIRVADGETGTSCSIAKDAVFCRNRDQLIFMRNNRVTPFQHPIELRRRYQFDRFGFGSSASAQAPLSADPNVEYVDADTMAPECLLRNWKEGDWFIPLGMQEKKKLSDFFIDEKIPLFQKMAIPILVSNGEIVWICGMRLDERHKITPKTVRILKLEYTPRYAHVE